MAGRTGIRATTGILLGGLFGFCQSLPVPQQVESHLHRAQQFLKENHPELAVNEFRSILKLDPRNVSAEANLGTLLYFEGDYKQSAPLLRAAVQQNPDLWKTQTLLGMCEKRTGDTANARLDLEKAFPQVQEKKLRIQAGMELVEIYYAAGELGRASDLISALRQIDPTDANILYTAHRVYSDQANEAMLSLAMAAPGSARMHELMAQEVIRQGNTAGAIAHYREAIKIDPLLPGIHFELAEALSAPGTTLNEAESEKEYAAAVKQNPFDEKAECRLGKFAAARSDLKAAFAHYSRALELQPEDAEANLGLGKAYASMNELAKAEPLLAKSVQLDPTDPVAHFRLGTLYRQMGKADESRHELAEFQRYKDMQQRLIDLYREMRLHKPGMTDEDTKP